MTAEPQSSAAPEKHVRHPGIATPLRYLFALFLVSTGFTTIGFGVRSYPLPDEPSRFRDFMQAIDDTGYIVFWVGLVEFIAGSLLFVRRTTPLALLIALPNTVNILLYCIFIANRYLLIGVPDFLCNVFLTYAWFDWYQGCFEN